LRIVWTDDAVANVEAFLTYIATFHPAAADRMIEELIAVADSLSDCPNRGRDVTAATR